MVTVITKTIGPTGRDYATFQLAEAATSSIGTSANLVANDEAIVFEADDTTFTAGGTFYIANTSLTADATRNVSYTAASGRPVYTYTGTGTAVQFYDAYTRWSGIDVVGGSAGKVMNVRANAGYGAAQAGTLIENATITAATTAVACEKLATGQALGTSSEPITLRNLVTKSKVAVSQYISGTGHTTGAHCLVVNCTHLGGSSPNQVWNWALTGGMPDASFKIINCANLAQNSSSDANITGGGVDVSGSTNNIGNAAGLPSPFHFANIGGGIGAQYTPTTSFSTPLGAGDYSVFMGATGALADKTGNDVWQQGVGPGSNSDVPTTDINGVARSGASCNPGAFEADGFVAPTVTTQTIGPVGRDYATFTLAAASMASLDLTYTNEAYVFEADAGTYTSGFSASSTVVADATRNVTYRPAAGSEHGGIAGAGVHLDTGATNRPFTIYGEFVVIEGLSLTTTTTYCTWTQGAGAIIRNCISTGAIRSFLVYAGTAQHPVVLENCVGSQGTSHAFLVLGGGPHGGIANARVVNCTGSSTGNDAFRTQANVSGTSATAEYINCVGLSTYTHQAVGSFTTVTGSNNVGSAFNRWPVGTRLNGLFYTLTTSFSTPLGAGDYAVYMGATGALADKPGNDVWQQGVGPSANASVPTTDINGVARSGANCNPGAFEADGFVEPTITTQTIGPTGKDYATFTLAEASLPSEDITFTNRAFVFKADAATYSENVYFDSNLTMDATRQVTYKPASGAEHGGVRGAGVLISSSGINSPRDDYTTFEGLEVVGSATQVFNIQACTGVTLRSCIIDAATQGMVLGDAIDLTVENCVLDTAGNYAINPQFSAGTGSFSIRNCTFVQGSGTAIRAIQSGTAVMTIDLINNLRVGAGGCYYASGDLTKVTETGSNNFGGSTQPYPVSLQGSPYPITASTAYDPGAGDFALYVGKNGALLDSPHNDVIDGGVGPASNSDVPTTDILGDTRSGTTTNPGAFALAQATAVLTRTIGPSGRDYATFTEAEADVENIGGSADLVFENERIEFEADAATYSESVMFDSTLTTDATRNVTYRPVSGSEHGAVFGAGVVLHDNGSGYGASQQIRDNFTVLDGLEVHVSNTSGFRTGLALSLTHDLLGVRIRNMLLWSQTQRTPLAGPSTGNFNTGSASAPIVFENLLIRKTDNFADMLEVKDRPGYEGHHIVTNCTFISDSAANHRAFSVRANTTLNVQITNTMSLVPWQWFQAGSGTLNLTGSNNFGPASQPFPAALQGSPYPITATTDTTPGFGDYAIYEAATGALIVVDDNAALGGGVGPAANADVPVFDINGVKRIGGGCDPGAFEGVRSRSLDVWDVVAARHTTPGSFGELMQQIKIAATSAASSRVST